MSPRDLVPAVVSSRLAQMSLLLTDLEQLGPVTAEQLRTDRQRRHVVHQVLTQLVQLAVAVNGHLTATVGGTPTTSYRESFDGAVTAGALPAELAQALKPSVGLRNVVVHAYLDVDEAVVAAAVPLAARDYRRYVDSVAGWLLERPDER